MKFIDGWRAHSFVHMCWIIGILTFLVIFLASWKIGPNESVKDILNFAVSFSSLILAVFAIGQTLIASSALPDAVSDVRAAINDVKHPASQLEAAVSIISGYSKSIEEKTHSLSEIAAGLASQRSDLGPARTGGEFSQIDLSDQILVAAPAVFKVGLYVIFKSHETKKPYMSPKLIKDLGQYLNVLGIISALDALGIISTAAAPNGLPYISNLGSFDWLVKHGKNLVEAKTDIERAYYPLILPAIEDYYQSNTES